MSENKTIGYILNESSIPGFTENNIIHEKENGKVVAEAVLQECDVKNRNGRIYPKDELFPQLTCQRTLELLESGTLLGELGHPLSTDLVRQQTIDPTRVCVRFLKLWTVGNLVWARYEPTNNAYGNMINEDLKEGVKPAFSLRALGSIEQTPKGNIVHNLRIITWDSVVYPSHPNAYTHNVVSEQAKAIDSNQNTIPALTEEARVIPITNAKVIDYLQNTSDNFKYMKDYFNFMYESIKLSPDGRSVILEDADNNKCVVNLEKQLRKDIMDYCLEQYQVRKV